MRLSAPKFLVWLLALVLAALAIVSKYTGIPYIGSFVRQYDFWFMTAAYGLLFLGTLFKGL
ncbi:MAG: hypothetical protein GX417_10515 [Clostridiales bacterium]|jgi:hypothetical protein|nr:hypothetical protein [Clostridiales bacterium]